MKTLLIGALTAVLALSTAVAQTTTTTKTTTTYSTASGTLNTYVPGTSFVVKETTGPVSYNYGPDVVYATRAGTVLTQEQVQARIRVGVPVRVEYAPQGETRVIHRVVVDEDD